MTEEVQLENNEGTIERASELRQEFSDLENAKREKIESQAQSSNTDNSSSMAIQGVVEDMENVHANDEVIVTVSYVLDDETKTTEFSLDFPSSEDDFSASNKFVRMVNFFGDKKNDPTGLLQRKVWLKITDEEVSLHVPESLSKLSVAREKAKRKAVSKGLQDWGRSNKETYRDGVVSAVLAGFGLFGFASLASATTVFFALMTAMVAFVMSIVGILVIGLVISVIRSQSKNVYPFVIMACLLSMVACLSGELGLVTYSIPNQANTTRLSYVIQMWGTQILLTTAMFLGKKPVAEASHWVVDKKNKVKMWYQKRKGIEYVET